MIDGIIFSCQYLIITRDEPLFAKEIIKESGFSERELLDAQRKTFYESKKINKVIREAFL